MDARVTEMKVEIAMDVIPGVTITFHLTRFVDTDEDAEEAGDADKHLVDAYFRGYGEAL